MNTDMSMTISLSTEAFIARYRKHSTAANKLGNIGILPVNIIYSKFDASHSSIHRHCIRQQRTNTGPCPIGTNNQIKRFGLPILKQEGMGAITSRADPVQVARPLNAPWSERIEKHCTQFGAVNFGAILLSHFAILKEDSPHFIKNAKPLVLVAGDSLKLRIKSSQMHGTQTSTRVQIQRSTLRSIHRGYFPLKDG